MTRTYECAGDAREAVKTAVGYLDEEQRWALLQRWLEEESRIGKAPHRSLRLEALRSIVCPRVGDREWDRVVRECRKIEWAGELRLADARGVVSIPRPRDPQGRGVPAGRRQPHRSRPGSTGESAW